MSEDVGCPKSAPVIEWVKRLPSTHTYQIPPSERTRLSVMTPRYIGPGRARTEQALQRHPSLQSRVSAEKDAAHPAGSDRSDDQVRSDPAANFELTGRFECLIGSANVVLHLSGDQHLVPRLAAREQGKDLVAQRGIATPLAHECLAVLNRAVECLYEDVLRLLPGRGTTALASCRIQGLNVGRLRGFARECHATHGQVMDRAERSEDVWEPRTA
jgi:hypothetical protein